jgi:hypothetical protein
MADVVNFGKYRGQPIEILASDRGYCDWLMAQPWFRERYQNLYTVIINHYQQPADTPDHNALQALFLDEGYREAFLDLVDPDWAATGWRWHCDRLRDELDRWEEAAAKAEREVAEAQERARASGRDPTTIDRTGWYFGKSAEQTLANAREQLAQAQAHWADHVMTLRTRVVFEEGNIDVCIGVDLYADAARKNHLGYVPQHRGQAHCRRRLPVRAAADEPGQRDHGACEIPVPRSLYRGRRHGGAAPPDFQSLGQARRVPPRGRRQACLSR